MAVGATIIHLPQPAQLIGAGTSFECDFKSVASKSAPPSSLATDSGGISNGAPVTAFTLPGVTNGGGTNNVAPDFSNVIPFPNQPADNFGGHVSDSLKALILELDRACLQAERASARVRRRLCVVQSLRHPQQDGRSTCKKIYLRDRECSV